MGCGKTTMGRKLSKYLDAQLIDLDHEIEKITGMAISEYFSLHGEAAFRELEKKTLQTYDYAEHCVVATGGGTPCFFDNMEWMNDNGTTVYLQMEPAQLVSRLHNRQKRPLIRDMDDEQLLAFINMKLAERNPFYYKAKLIVNSFDLDAETLEQKIFQQ